MAKENTQETLAQLTGLTQQRISQLQREGVILRGENAILSIRKIIAHQGQVAAGWKSGDGRIDRMEQAALLDMRKREEIELKLSERRGELIPIESIKEALIYLAGTIRTKLLALPARLKSQSPTLTAKQLAIADTIVREILNELSHARFPAAVDDIAQRYMAALHAAPEANDRRVGGQPANAQP